MSQPPLKPEYYFDVAIVGGGLVGATLAVLLADTQLQVALVEAQVPSDEFPSLTAPFDSRVSAFTIASKRLLENSQVWDSVAAHRHSPFEKMCVWDAEGTGEILFAADDLGVPALGYILENSLVTAALYQRIGSAQNIKVFAPAEIAGSGRDQTGGHWLTLANQESLRAALLVGADGAQSQVRAYANIAIDETPYRQSAVVTTVKLGQSHQRTAWQRFLPTGPLAFLPLSRGAEDNYCSIVWSLDTACAEKTLRLSDTDFKSALERASEKRLGSIVELDKRVAFPLVQRHAKQYFNERVVLVGDAAHTIHPLAGQGVNLGLMDAAVFAEEILRAHSRGLDIYHESVLARYQRRRAGENRLMMAAVRGFKELFGSSELWVRWLRSTGMSWVNRAGPLKEQIVERAMGLSGDLPEMARRPGLSDTSR